MTFGWLDIEDIAEALLDAHRDIEPTRLRFTQLRQMIEALPGFSPDPEHPVNEKILEHVQAEWLELRSDAPSRNANADDDDD